MKIIIGNRQRTTWLIPHGFSDFERAVLIFLMICMVVTSIVTWVFRLSNVSDDDPSRRRAAGPAIVMTVIEAIMDIMLCFSIRFLWRNVFPIPRLLFLNLLFCPYWIIVCAIGWHRNWLAERTFGMAYMIICIIGIVYSIYKNHIYYQDLKEQEARRNRNQVKDTADATSTEQPPPVELEPVEQPPHMQQVPVELEPVHTNDRPAWGEDSVMAPPPPYEGRAPSYESRR
ncbi:hypothetical protein CAC42_6068 [Sphaceloma murrayae]|uniref:Uncharacterized protein n=1 Tax=Sphaceloma murrayae TaxID=2082308 RepID=A0A2K1QVQ7_9PEZI|nr:hypothetical protein CAC42_6068 [Sphaceloma murrayae]